METEFITLIVSDFHIDETKRLNDTVVILNYLVDIIVAAPVHRVIILGDVFNKRKPTPKELRVFNQWLVKVHVYANTHIIEGNHDQDRGISSLSYLPDLVVANVTVHTPPIILDGFYLGHEQIAEGVADNGVILGGDVSIHNLIKNNPDVKVFAFGHFHKPQILSQSPLAFYAGSIDATSFSQADDTKWAWLFKDMHLEKRIVLPTRPMRQFNVLVKEGFDPGPFWGEANLEGALVKVVFTGTREALKQVKTNTVKRIFLNDKKVYRLYMSYVILDKSKVRNENITESVTEEAALREYFKDHKDRDRLIEEGLKIIRGTKNA